jgi:hypothetical protein
VTRTRARLRLIVLADVAAMERHGAAPGPGGHRRGHVVSESIHPPTVTLNSRATGPGAIIMTLIRSVWQLIRLLSAAASESGVSESESGFRKHYRDRA